MKDLNPSTPFSKIKHIAARSGLLAALLLPASHAASTTLTYSSFSTWKTDVSNPVELDFTKINPNSSYSTAAGKTLTPANNPALAFVFTGIYGGGYQLTGGRYTSSNIVSLFGPTSGPGSIKITMPAGGENAVFLGLGSTGNASNIAITLSDGQIFNVAASPNTSQLFGLSLSHNIDWLTLSTSTTIVSGDFLFAQSKLSQDPAIAPVAPAFEGSTFSLLGGGMLSLLGFRFKARFRKQSC